MCLAISNNLLLVLQVPQNAFFLQTRDLLVSQKTMQRHFFSALHPLSMVNFATATVLAFVLLRDSRFNFHYYTQREATPTQKLARMCAATSHDFLCERLQSAFTLANQLRRIAQYAVAKPCYVYIYMLWPNVYVTDFLERCVKNSSSSLANDGKRIDIYFLPYIRQCLLFF